MHIYRTWQTHITVSTFYMYSSQFPSSELNRNGCLVSGNCTLYVSIGNKFWYGNIIQRVKYKKN